MIWFSKDGKAFVVFSLHMLYLLDENLNCFLRNLKCDINAAELGIDRWTLMFKSGVSSTKVRSGVYGYYLTLKRFICIWITDEKRSDNFELYVFIYVN